VMNLACSGLAPNTRKEDWLAIAGTDSKLRNGMDRLYGLFENAPVLGSLVNPRAGEGDLLQAAFHDLQPLLEKALAQETKDDTAHEMAVTARGLARAAEILAGQFTLVATNVPYLGRGKQDEVLRDYCEQVHPEAKSDLATCFVERCLQLSAANGSTALVTPQNWLFLGTYKRLRMVLLHTTAWNVVVDLGPAAFDDMNWWAATTVLLVHSNSVAYPDDRTACIDVSPPRDPKLKAVMLPTQPATLPRQAAQSRNPDSRILFEEHTGEKRLFEVSRSLTGLQTSDNDRYSFLFWELPALMYGWEFFQRTSETITPFSGRTRVLRTGDEDLGARRCHGHEGVLVHRMNALPATLLAGTAFDQNGAGIIPNDPKHLPALWCFLGSSLYRQEVRKLDTKVGVTPATLVKVPFDLAYWQKVAAEKYPDGLPKPFSSDPTQWLFNGHPAGADQPLHVAVARLLGYQWPRQAGSSFPDCPSLGPDGLERHADDDGIVPINPMRGEPAASERLQVLLRDSFAAKGVSFDLGVVSGLLGEAGSKSTDLNDWLLNEFFEQHCKLFHNRPFVWHIWDGRKDGFNVLVNYHKLAAPGDAGRQLLEKLTYDYLKDWIDRQRDGVKANAAGAEARLAAAIKLEKELIKIIAGEPPYDIFVRWKPLSEQAIGWQPDINDGVRLNIRPFLMAQDVGKKGAGILRVKPNIKWEKDRGKEPERSKVDFPWFWSCDPEANPGHATDFSGGREFTGERWNALHYTNAAKTAARQVRSVEKSRAGGRS
jgi:hypothetical protein